MGQTPTSPAALVARALFVPNSHATYLRTPETDDLHLLGSLDCRSLTIFGFSLQMASVSHDQVGYSSHEPHSLASAFVRRGLLSIFVATWRLNNTIDLTIWRVEKEMPL